MSNTPNQDSTLSSRVGDDSSIDGSSTTCQMSTVAVSELMALSSSLTDGDTARQSLETVTPPAEPIEVDEVDEEDMKIQKKLGYTQELHRGISGWFMNFCTTFLSTAIVPSVCTLFGYGLQTGGPSTMVWCWVISCVFSTMSGAALAEICSSYPNSGGVYYWVGQLAPPHIVPLVSFICGWSNWMANLANTASFASGVAQLIGAATCFGGRILNRDEIAAISIGFITLWAAQNLLRIDTQSWFNGFGAVFQILSIPVIVIVLLATAEDRSSGAFVFTQYENLTGWEGGRGYIYMIGLLTALYGFAGYDSGSHLAEETKNAHKAAPMGIIGACVMGSITGFVFTVGVLFSTPGVQTVLNGPANKILYFNFDANIIVSNNTNPLINLFLIDSGWSGGLSLTIIVIMDLYFTGTSALTILVRTTFCLARDGVFPYSNLLTKVNQKTKAPIGSLIMVWFICSFLLLLQFVSTDAFTAIISISTIGYQVSYALPMIMRVVYLPKQKLGNGFTLGIFSLPMNIISCFWLFTTLIPMFWPFTFPIAANNMNYSVVIVVGFLIVGTLFWIFSARKWFQGPKRLE